ncbi:hypothetical protein LIA77_11523 [Sarocladium implicatum]|nr:hypothetical protein LIA77_11523 [Sarocladium implicatum]
MPRIESHGAYRFSNARPACQGEVFVSQLDYTVAIEKAVYFISYGSAKRAAVQANSQPQHVY